MGFFNNFPYTNFHELNLDWLLNAMKQLRQAFEDFAETNTLHYADPLEWSITTQYPAMTLVRDPISDYIFMSLQNVPAGITLDNTDYWYRVGDLSAYAHELDVLEAMLQNRMYMREKDPVIAFAGASSVQYIADYPDSLLTDFFDGAEIINLNDGTNSTVKWENIPDQIDLLTKTPDYLFLWVGGADVPASLSEDVGAVFGPPDVEDHTVSATQPTEVFPLIKYVLNKIRRTYPTTAIYFVSRRTPTNKPAASWKYFTYYQEQIMYEWGVPTIDLQTVANLSMFISQNVSAFTRDGSHFNEAGYARVLSAMAQHIQTGGSAVDASIPPNYFFAPGSVVDTNSARLGHKNKEAVLTWVCQHCLVPGQGRLCGTGRAYSGLGLTYARFDSQIDLSSGGMSTVWYAVAGVRNWFTFVNGAFQERGYDISTRTLLASNTTRWTSLEPGSYSVSSAAISTLSLPANVEALITGNYTIMEIREFYDSGYDPTYRVCILYPTTKNLFIKGYYRFSNNTQGWYQGSMSAITI